MAKGMIFSLKRSYVWTGKTPYRTVRLLKIDVKSGHPQRGDARCLMLLACSTFQCRKAEALIISSKIQSRQKVVIRYSYETIEK